MKRAVKTTAIALCIAAAILCTGCKSEAVKNTEQLISKIGTVTLDSGDAISEARSSYESLGDEQKDVENVQTLQDAENQYSSLLQSEAAPIEEAIAAIPQPVAEEAADMVSRAYSLYARASDSVKAAVSNADVLNDARTALEDIKVQAAIDAIDAIGEVTLNSQDVIDAAKSAYGAIDASRQSDVTNYNTLKEAESTIAQLKKDAAEAAGKAAVAKLTASKDEVEGITWYEPSCYPTYKNTRCFVLPYIGEQNGHYWLRCKVDYAGNDWVFFTQIVINVDGVKRDTITFDYGDVVRDTAFGAKLSEVADFAPTDSQIKLLNDIANSEKTIIRFQGSDYYYDFTVSAKDKQGIKDVFAAYEYLN